MLPCPLRAAQAAGDVPAMQPLVGRMGHGAYRRRTPQAVDVPLGSPTRLAHRP